MVWTQVTWFGPESDWNREPDDFRIKTLPFWLGETWHAPELHKSRHRLSSSLSWQQMYFESIRQRHHIARLVMQRDDRWCLGLSRSDGKTAVANRKQTATHRNIQLTNAFICVRGIAHRCTPDYLAFTLYRVSWGETETGVLWWRHSSVSLHN